ncbi:MAG: WhiB family transcriptional regulator, redox-sensing transcriptional regulator [Actinomycetota bacterium]|jgi:WhiB family redox-sensing transcriptional regulator|nr:WhiB family transcriptional regulator, redox-sensing transcriptional regulator [Actinomycetota bacterium]
MPSPLDPATWRSRGNCHGADVNLFFPDAGDVAGEAAAKAICAGCPVRAICLDFALDGDDVGIWGGVGGATRRRLRKARRKANRTGPPNRRDYGGPPTYTRPTPPLPKLRPR